MIRDEMPCPGCGAEMETYLVDTLTASADGELEIAIAAGQPFPVDKCPECGMLIMPSPRPAFPRGRR